jgi:hypothetical protein
MGRARIIKRQLIEEANKRNLGIISEQNVPVDPEGDSKWNPLYWVDQLYQWWTENDGPYDKIAKDLKDNFDKLDFESKKKYVRELKNSPLYKIAIPKKMIDGLEESLEVAEKYQSK